MSRRSVAKLAYPEVSAEIVDQLFAKDPSGGAYGKWMVSQVGRGESPEDVTAEIEKFHEVKSRLPSHLRDLYAYGDLVHLRGELEPFSERSKRAARKEGYTLLREYPKVAFYRVDTFEGMEALGRDTKWCLTNRRQYEDHSHRTILVAINRTKGGRGPYSKIAFYGGSFVPSAKFFLWWNWLKELCANEGSELLGWGVWDALDARLTGYSDPHPLCEMLDLLAGQEGATDAVLNEDVDHEPAKALLRIYKKLQGARGPALVKVAKEVAKQKLFNPLSLLNHPGARSVAACTAIWDLSTPEDRSVLDIRILGSLAFSAALNVPQLFDAYERSYVLPRLSQRKTWKAMRISLSAILEVNSHLTKETKRKLLGLFSQATLGPKG